MYISLKEATKYCNYSQDYLKLRARQGKLKAIKIGRNWVTTRTWLQDYLSKIAQPVKLNCLTPEINQVSSDSEDEDEMKFHRLNAVRSGSARPDRPKPALAQKIFVIFLILSLLIAGGLFSLQWQYSVNISKEYFQWVNVQIADLSNVFQLEKIIPTRVIEIKLEIK